MGLTEYLRNRQPGAFAPGCLFLRLFIFSGECLFHENAVLAVLTGSILAAGIKKTKPMWKLFKFADHSLGHIKIPAVSVEKFFNDLTHQNSSFLLQKFAFLQASVYHRIVKFPTEILRNRAYREQLFFERQLCLTLCANSTYS